jgi:hypothetical protein
VFKNKLKNYATSHGVTSRGVCYDESYIRGVYLLVLEHRSMSNGGEPWRVS